MSEARERLIEYHAFFAEETSVMQMELAAAGLEPQDQALLAFMADCLRVCGWVLEGRCRPPVLMRESVKRQPITFEQGS